MILDTLKLRSYRNLGSIDLTWNKHFNVIYGENAQGKTNLLEAIYLLGHLKSFRGARGQDLINHTAETAFISAMVNKGNVSHKLESSISMCVPQIVEKRCKFNQIHTNPKLFTYNSRSRSIFDIKLCL